MLTLERVNELLRYEPGSGKLFWKKTTTNRITAGSEAGTICDTTGYRQIQIDKKLYGAHRIVMFMHNKDFDKSKQIDHINHNKDDNRLENLRVVSSAENMRNQSKLNTNKTGITGVYFNKSRNKFIAQIKVSHQVYYLGCYNTLEEAAAAREEANIKYGFHENHGI